MYDFAVLWSWAEFAVRWLHVITGIAWIGSSFYFIALDLGLNRNVPGPADGEGHGKAGKDATKQADKDDDQANFDAIKSKQHLLPSPSYFGRALCAFALCHHRADQCVPS